MKFNEVINLDYYSQLAHNTTDGQKKVNFIVKNKSDIDIHSATMLSIGHYLMNEDDVVVYSYYDNDVVNYVSSEYVYRCDELLKLKPIFKIKHSDGTYLESDTIGLGSGKISLELIGFVVINSNYSTTTLDTPYGEQVVVDTKEVALFRQVFRKAEVGDYIAFPKVHGFWSNGIQALKKYEVVNGNDDPLQFLCANGFRVNIYGKTRGYDTEQDVLVYEKI